MKRYHKSAECCVKPIKGATNQPTMMSDCPYPISGAVALQPDKHKKLGKIKGAVNWPK